MDKAQQLTACHAVDQVQGQIYNLAIMYENGKGVAQDYAKALAIYSQCRSPPRGRAPEDLRFQEFYISHLEPPRGHGFLLDAFAVCIGG